MKTKISILSLVIAWLLLSCTQDKLATINENSNNRIKLKESVHLNGYVYSIIEVDSIEFITRSEGGFARISK